MLRKVLTMASEVMTFDSIVSKVRHEIDDNEGGYLNLTGDRVKEVLDELEAAHKRDVAELRERLEKAESVSLSKQNKADMDVRYYLALCQEKDETITKLRVKLCELNNESFRYRINASVSEEKIKEMSKEHETHKKEVEELRNGLERAINIICGKCYDKVRAKCARGEKKDCEVMELRKALAKE